MVECIRLKCVVVREFNNSSVIVTVTVNKLFRCLLINISENYQLIIYQLVQNAQGALQASYSIPSWVR